MKATLTYLGPSRDCRTNRWRVYCECGKSFEPDTTMFSKQNIICNRCGSEYVADYNSRPASLSKVGGGQ